MRLIRWLLSWFRQEPVTIAITVIPNNPDWPIAWRKVAYEHFLPIEDSRGVPWTGCQGVAYEGERCGCREKCKIVFKDRQDVVMVPVRE